MKVIINKLEEIEENKLLVKYNETEELIIDIDLFEKVDKSEWKVKEISTLDGDIYCRTSYDMTGFQVCIVNFMEKYLSKKEHYWKVPLKISPLGNKYY